MRRRLTLLLCALLVLGACNGDDDDAGDDTTTSSTTEPAALVRMNEIQVLGSHNSYHLRPAPEVLEGVAALAGEQVAAELDYEHQPLTDQLELHGIRQFEIDVYADPEGGRFANRPAAALVGLPFDRGTFDDLEAEILSVFDHADLITPDDVRGEADTLEEAVLAGDAWPTLEDAAGKVLFSLVDLGPTRDTYVGDAPSLEGRLLFTSSEEGRPDAAFIRVDDPIAEGDRIRQLVEDGYLVRTRTDVPGIDAPAADTARRDAAIGSGAQYLSTDYYVAEPLLETGYEVDLPGDAAARCNPVNAPEGCDLG